VIEFDKKQVFGPEKENPYTIYLQDLAAFIKRYYRKSKADNLSGLEVIQKRFFQLEMPISNDRSVSMSEFTKKYSMIRDLEAFEWLFKVFAGFENKHLNWQEQSTPKGLDERRPTVNALDKTKQSIEKHTKLTPEDLEVIQAFYDEEIKGRTAKYVYAIYSKMFSQIKNPTLKQKYFLQAAVSKSGS
jgi:hypothetical protein